MCAAVPSLSHLSCTVRSFLSSSSSESFREGSLLDVADVEPLVALALVVAGVLEAAVDEVPVSGEVLDPDADPCTDFAPPLTMDRVCQRVLS